MKTSPLSAAEVEWVRIQLAIAVELARAYTGDSEEPPTLQRLDTTWLAWHGDADPSRVDANTVVNALGIAFGTHLKASLGLDWVIATDEYGSDLAIFGQPNDVTFFPANMIGKRAQEQAPIFTQLHTASVEGVRKLRSRR